MNLSVYKTLSYHLLWENRFKFENKLQKHRYSRYDRTMSEMLSILGVFPHRKSIVNRMKEDARFLKEIKFSEHYHNFLYYNLYSKYSFEVFSFFKSS
jgi:hypothetical protein